MHLIETDAPEVVGPYSVWPRRHTERRVSRDTK